ncbi:helix-turn-helix domain-containing protein [Jatrophihabitans fulvus]
MTRSTEDVLAGVGDRLRTLRRDRQVTLAALAEATGITASTLSRLETGRLRPTLEQLLPLARAHGVALDELVDAPPTGDPRVVLKPLRRHGRVYIPLTRRAGGIQAYKVIMPPTPPSSRRPRLQTHDGYEWLYVMDGRVRLLLGERDLEMGPGEAAEFDTRTPHWIGAVGDRPAETLSLFGVEGQRAHVTT